MKKKQMGVFNWTIFILLALYAISMFVLLAWGAITAFKIQNEFRVNKLWLPKSFYLGNFTLIIQKFYVFVTNETGSYSIGIDRQLLNTLLYAGGGALLLTIAPCLVSYACVKFDGYFYSKMLNYIVIVTMILPIVGAYPSMIQVLETLGLYDTMLGIWLQKFNFLGIYFLTFSAAYKGIPKEFSEAAYIDGANEWQTLLRIILPLVRNMFFTVFLIHFVEMWNDYQVSLLYTPSYPTLARGVYEISRKTAGELATVPVRMMACMILVIPILVLFIAFQNRLMGNVSMGGVKE